MRGGLERVSGLLEREGVIYFTEDNGTILNKERKVETRGYIKLGVMEPKIKDKSKPSAHEQIIPCQST